MAGEINDAFRAGTSTDTITTTTILAIVPAM